MVQTTTQLAADMVAALVAQGVEFDNPTTLAATWAAEIADWLGGAEAVPADLAQKVLYYLGQHTAEMLQRSDWVHGAVDGGPNSDGEYPFTMPDGSVELLPCLAKILSLTEKGDAGGLVFLFDTATTDADPGTGKVRFNHATPSSVTQLFFDAAEVGGQDVTGWLDSLDDNPAATRGTLFVQDPSGKFLVFRVTGATTVASGYRKVSVTHVAGTVLPANGARIAFTFAPTGPVGVTSSTNMAFDTATADADPGAGEFRLNNANPALATAAYVDNLDADGGNVAAWWDSFDDAGGTLAGTLLIKGVTHTSHFALYQVTGSVVDGTGYRKLTLTHLASNGAWAASDLFVFTFSPAGQRGATGPTGVPFLFSTTTTDSDPGAGRLRMNHGAIGSVTQLFVDNASQLGATMTSWLDAMDDSPGTIKGHLLLLETDTNATALFNITGAVTDGTGYRKVAVTYVAGPGGFTNNNQVGVLFVPAGATGANGPSVGSIFLFSTTTTDADPGAGALRANHGTLASVTQLFVDNADLGGNAITAWLDSFDDSSATLKGQLTLKQIGAPGKFAVFNVTGAVVDGTGYRKVPVALVSAGSLFDNGAEITASFVRAGDTGPAANIGRNSFPFPALAFTKRPSNGPADYRVETASNKVVIEGYEFDKDSDRFMQLSIAMPKGWDESTFTFQIRFVRLSGATAYQARFGLRARAVRDGDAIDGSWGSWVYVNKSAPSAETEYVTADSPAVTPGGTVAPECRLIIEVARIGSDGADTLDANAVIEEVTLHFNMAAANDA